MGDGGSFELAIGKTKSVCDQDCRREAARAARLDCEGSVQLPLPPSLPLPLRPGCFCSWHPPQPSRLLCSWLSPDLRGIKSNTSVVFGGIGASSIAWRVLSILALFGAFALPTGWRLFFVLPSPALASCCCLAGLGGRLVCFGETQTSSGTPPPAETRHAPSRHCRDAGVWSYDYGHA